MSILDFLTGGVFDTAKELIINIIEYLIRFIMNMANIFIYPLVNKINAILPNIDDLDTKLQQVFNFSSTYINFILDMLFITSPILIYLFASIIFRVSIRSSSYLSKLLIAWYDKLVP